uniref:Uncharacterized protein n=1 Tax=Arundo donax TaxID=35708 RepID=A0A0A8XYP8_ARUDO
MACMSASRASIPRARMRSILSTTTSRSW